MLASCFSQHFLADLKVERRKNPSGRHAPGSRATLPVCLPYIPWSIFLVPASDTELPKGHQGMKWEQWR